ncbi:Multidrug resistance-associated protein 1 [Beauveria bassiana]|uniref:Multidrug resistance-associated protein 1 n=1 Tax=Beauveria bassiana TaxID=176275 RepID=A0A2N6NRC8_BEABA|nr:Multidrug resistance-associated protein 1 [Beauveria bassiana]
MNSTSTSSNCDASLGPTASHCGAASRFDFTVAFEHSALSITPYVIFLSAAIPRLFYLWKHNRKIIGITFVALQLIVLVSWSLYHGPVSSRLGIVSSALGLATALVMAALSYLEHERTVRPSTILCVYLLLSILFDAAQCRTLWLLHAQQPAQQRALLPALFTAQLANKVLMLLVESLGKTRYLVGPWKALKRCPEAVASVFSRCSFWWLNDLLTRGFSATLDLDTLYETDEALRSSKLVSEFQGRIVETKPSKYRLLLVIAACLKVTLIKTVIARVFVTGFKFAKPFLLQYIITFVQNDQKGGEYHKEIAFALIAATGLLFIGTAVATGFYNHHLYRSLVMIRGGLISLVCTESLGVSTTVASEMATLTLIGPDVEVVCNACSGVHDLWANPVEIGLATWLLARQLGVGCVGPVASALLCFILMSQLPKRMGPAIKAWNVAIQKRVSVTSRVVGSIRETKMLGLVPVCLDYIQSLRVFELKESRQFRMLIVYMNLLVFTSLSIMGLLMSPLANLLSSFPSFVSSLGIFERFEDLLKQTKFHDTIVNHNRGRGTAPSKSTHSVIELSRIPENCITLRKACLSAEIGGEALLHDIDLTIKPGELCVVSGKVGSGKSLLLQALLGELPVVDGNVHIDVARFGYCSQSAWLFKGTVRDNIVGWTTADFDETRYNTVIKACDLVKDLAQLSDGDMTVLSTKAMYLKALARALYAAPHVFVIDDIFASLDPTTRSYVWEQVFGPSGLARALGSAVIIATHSGEFPPFQARISPADVPQVHIMERADHVVIMEQCRILRQGPYTAAAVQKYPVQGNDTGSSGEQPKQTPAVANSTNDAAVSKEKYIKQQIDDLVQSQGDTSLYWYYFKSVGWKYGLIGLSLATSVEVFLVMGQIWLKWWTESNFSDNKTSDAMYYGVYCIFGLAKLVSLGSDVCLVNRFSQDMTLVDQDLPIAVFTSLKGSLSVIGSGALVMLGSAYLAATIPVALALLYALQKFYLRTSRQLRLLQLRASTPLFSYLVESAEGLATVRAFCWEIPLQHQAVSLVDLSQRPSYLLYAIQRWLAFVLDMMVGGLAVILVALAVVVRQSGPGSVAVSLFNVLGFSTVLAQLVTSWTQLETSLGAIARLRTFEQTTPRELEKPGTKEPPFDWPSRGAIEIRNLWASYRSSNLAPATAFDPSTSVSLDAPIGENDLPVLRQLTVSIRPGEKVAICGRTGSGKSSLVLTLYQLLRYSGTTIIDGVDISLVPLDTLRTRLISVPQEPYLFPATIRFNLRPGACSSPADDEKLLDALAQVSLRDTVLAVPGGLDANVADVCLSQGQKQLFSLARALVIKNDRGSSGGILVLDEATSAMDTATERLMMDVVEGAFANYTVLAVAHRLESVRQFDRVLVLDQGVLVRISTPTELIREDSKVYDP